MSLLRSSYSRHVYCSAPHADRILHHLVHLPTPSQLSVTVDTACRKSGWGGLIPGLCALAAKCLSRSVLGPGLRARFG